MIKPFTISIFIIILQLGVNNIYNEHFFFEGKPTHPTDSPPTEKDVLFVVKHCKSPNIVVYKANRTFTKELNPQKPIDVYWQMNTKGKKVESLTFLEWKLAFGFKLHTILKGKKYKINLNAIKNKEIIIKQNLQGVVEGFMNIKGHYSKLKEVYIEFETSFVWPDVKYVDFSGIELATGKMITERIWNN